jgi:hypothetical protein
MEEIKGHKYTWYRFGCKDASYLKTKEDFEKLTFSEKLLLQFHLATCKYCRRFVKQINKINMLIRVTIDKSTLKIAPKKKLAINQLITEKLNKN